MATAPNNYNMVQVHFSRKFPTAELDHVRQYEDTINNCEELTRTVQNHLGQSCLLSLGTPEEQHQVHLKNVSVVCINDLQKSSETPAAKTTRFDVYLPYCSAPATLYISQYVTASCKEITRVCNQDDGDVPTDILSLGDQGHTMHILHKEMSAIIVHSDVAEAPAKADEAKCTITMIDGHEFKFSSSQDHMKEIIQKIQDEQTAFLAAIESSTPLVREVCVIDTGKDKQLFVNIEKIQQISYTNLRKAPKRGAEESDDEASPAAAAAPSVTSPTPAAKRPRGWLSSFLGPSDE